MPANRLPKVIATCTRIVHFVITLDLVTDIGGTIPTRHVVAKANTVAWQHADVVSDNSRSIPGGMVLCPVIITLGELYDRREGGRPSSLGCHSVSIDRRSHQDAFNLSESRCGFPGSHSSRSCLPAQSAAVMDRPDRLSFICPAAPHLTTAKS